MLDETSDATKHFDARDNSRGAEVRPTSAAQLASMISQGMTLEPATSSPVARRSAAGSIKPGVTVEIAIGGIGMLSNTFV